MKFKQIFFLITVIALSISSCSYKNGTMEGEYKKEGLNWLSMNQIEAAVKKSPKPILVDVFTPWCGPCKMLDRNTFSDPEVQKIFRENFHIVKFNAEGNDEYSFQGKTYKNPNFRANKRGRNSKNELASFFPVRGYPTLVLMDSNFKSIGKLVGYRPAEKLIIDLQQYIKK